MPGYNQCDIVLSNYHSKYAYYSLSRIYCPSVPHYWIFEWGLAHDSCFICGTGIEAERVKTSHLLRLIIEYHIFYIKYACNKCHCNSLYHWIRLHIKLSSFCWAIVLIISINIEYMPYYVMNKIQEHSRSTGFLTIV